MVNIIARLSRGISQHPSGMHDNYDLLTDKVVHKTESFVDFDGVQMVVTTTKGDGIKCNGDIEIEGVVDIVDLGGESGKSSYRNIWIKALNFRCLNAEK